MSAKARYDFLSSYRQQFLDTAVSCSSYTLPYLISEDLYRSRGNHKTLVTPWQSVGAKGVVTLASKLMLALLPPQTSFFKLQLNDAKLGEDFPPAIRSELDTSFAKMERMVMESIAASGDRVVVHQAIKHLVVGGNGAMFLGKDNVKFYPLNRYVVDRDGDGTWIELVTKELISRKLLEKEGLIDTKNDANRPGHDGMSAVDDDDVEIYTHVKRVDKQHIWYQEIDGKLVKGSNGSSPVDRSPWLVLRFNVVDGEAYGRGRVEEFLGDLKSLEALTQALVEGSAVAAKVLFLLNPGSTTKPAAVTAAPNGGIIQGKEGDLVPVQVGKAMDFRTAQEMAVQLTQRISEAFLVMNVRQSERTTAEEVRMTQMELESQLGGLFSLLTVEFLVPYLNRKLAVAQQSGDIKKIPKNLVRPTIVAGINAIGRGQDAESLVQTLTTISQVFGPQAIPQFMDPLEAIKRLCAAKGIDILNLVKTTQAVEQQNQQAIQTQKEMSLVDQTAALASTPMMDPTKNPQLQNGESNPLAANQGQADIQAPPQ
jgi:hypothetical protein